CTIGVKVSLFFGCEVARAQSLTVLVDRTSPTFLLGSSDCSSNCTITGGRSIGDSLFHEFEHFNVPESTTVTFLDGGARNIFARVLSGATEIDGTLSVAGDGNADFFLINPHGITFGPNSRLMGTGSFLFSTADRFIVSDKNDLASVEAETSLLTVTAPIGLAFESGAGGTDSGGILVRSGFFGSPGLQVAAGESLVLIGGDVVLDGARLTAPSGHIELSGVLGGSVVSVFPNLFLSYADVEEFRDTLLQATTAIDVSGTGGSLRIRSHDIEIAEQSVISATNAGVLSSGRIDLVADKDINISGFGIFFSALPESRGAGADLTISAENVTLSSGAVLGGGTLGAADGGDVSISASESVTIEGVGPFVHTLVTTSTQGTGHGGDINITAPQLNILGGAQVQAATYSAGSGGAVTIDATERVRVSGEGVTAVGVRSRSSILASSGIAGLPFQPPGDSGGVKIETGALTVSDGALVAVSGLGAGDSGDLTVDARSVRLSADAELSAAAAFGNGGNIYSENVETLVLRRDSLISTRAGMAGGLGDGGNIVIDADFIVAGLAENSDIIALAQQGRGGNIEIRSRGLYALEAQAAVAGNRTNDIDASSEFGVSGTVAIERLVNHSNEINGRVAVSVVEADTAVRQGCQTLGNRLIVTGRGGVPILPVDTVEVSDALVDLGGGGRTTIGLAEASSTALSLFLEKKVVSPPVSPPLIEAQGWRLNDLNEVVLSARSHTQLALLPSDANCTS
ncbi:MAG: filamentous hemagglutinin N-terminal domain-containing protein, partial [Cyanobacteria bacterium J06632_3]